MTAVEYRLRSDATRLPLEGNAILIHVVSDRPSWGLGFTQAIEARWPVATRGLGARLSALAGKAFLGQVLWTQLGGEQELGHLIAEDWRTSALNLEALRSCLTSVAEHARERSASVHTPVIGSGLCHAPWRSVYSLLSTELAERGVPVVVHCLGAEPPT